MLHKTPNYTSRIYQTLLCLKLAYIHIQTVLQPIKNNPIIFTSQLAAIASLLSYSCCIYSWQIYQIISMHDYLTHSHQSWSGSQITSTQASIILISLLFLIINTQLV